MQSEDAEPCNEPDRALDRLQRRYEHYKAGYLRYKLRYRRSAKVASVLGVACFVLLFVLIIELLDSITSDRELRELATDNQALQRKVVMLERRIEDLSPKLLEGEPAGLLRIEIDKLIPLNKSYVKAIQLSKRSGVVVFQLLVENRQSGALKPDILIELYDRSGAPIVAQHTVEMDSLASIAAGDAVSISGRFNSVYPEATFFRLSAN